MPTSQNGIAAYPFGGVAYDALYNNIGASYKPNLALNGKSTWVLQPNRSYMLVFYVSGTGLTTPNWGNGTAVQFLDPAGLDYGLDVRSPTLTYVVFYLYVAEGTESERSITMYYASATNITEDPDSPVLIINLIPPLDEITFPYPMGPDRAMSLISSDETRIKELEQKVEALLLRTGKSEID